MTVCCKCREKNYFVFSRFITPSYIKLLRTGKHFRLLKLYLGNLSYWSFNVHLQVFFINCLCKTMSNQKQEKDVMFVCGPFVWQSRGVKIDSSQIRYFASQFNASYAYQTIFHSGKIGVMDLWLCNVQHCS